MNEEPSSDTAAENDGRMDLALKASNEGIWDWRTDETEIYYSRLILEFLECGDQGAPNIFLPPHESIHKEDRERFIAALKSAFEPCGPELFAIDCRILTGSGNAVWLRIRGTVVRDTNGEATRIAGSMINISQRKAAEEQIEEDRHQLNMLIDRVPLQVYFKDTESRFAIVNRKLANWNGHQTPEDIIGKHDRDIFCDEHWKEAAEDEKRIMETGEPVIDKLEREVRDGTLDTWVKSSKFPWIDRKGIVRGTFGVSSDVTDLIRAQEQVKEFAAELAVRNQSYEEEIHLAREIQQALSTSGFPEIRESGTALEFESRYLPISGLAGDFFEVVKVSERTAGLLVCDVMGHGVRSALIVAMLRGLLEKQRLSAHDPSAFLSGLNSGLAAIMERAGMNMFATAFYTVIDLETNEMRSAIAGHPAALVNGSEGISLLGKERSQRGPGLGLIADASFPLITQPLDSVDRLLLYTDGIIEAENDDGEAYFEQRLIEDFSDRSKDSLKESLDGIVATVLAFSENNTFDDDVCLLAVDIKRD